MRLDLPGAALPAAWFVSAAHARQRQVAGTIQRRPYAEHHARAFGMTVTACGRPAVYWVNFYELAYAPGAPGACPACDAVVAGADRVS